MFARQQQVCASSSCEQEPGVDIQTKCVGAVWVWVHRVIRPKLADFACQQQAQPSSDKLQFD